MRIQCQHHALGMQLPSHRKLHSQKCSPPTWCPLPRAEPAVEAEPAAPALGRKLLQQNFWWQGIDESNSVTAAGSGSTAQQPGWWTDLANRISASSNLLDSRTPVQGMPPQEPLTAAPTAP